MAGFYGRKSDNAWRRELDKRVDRMEIKLLNQKKWGNARSGGTTPCSQCTRSMQKRIADKQIEFKRENAPICMACIAGIPRKKLEPNYYEKK